MFAEEQMALQDVQSNFTNNYDHGENLVFESNFEIPNSTKIHQNLQTRRLFEVGIFI